ncbi:MAG TPA: tetratricopeptide repeat protein [Verrucomicrobiae bacterium]|jgi:tetratricopeptide (TPR) repeat protein|nr:tetratricopeptide repeat protein [Verrucomicrobiae bacterium]
MAEKSVNEISRDVRVIFQKGNDALIRENYDYAVDLLMQVLEKEPTFYEGRKALRQAQARKAGSGGGFFKKAWSSASSSPLVAKGQIALRRNDPAEALQVGEQILNSDPASSSGHRLIAEAAIAMEMPRTAVMSLDILFKNSPKDKNIAIQYANMLAETGEAQRAERLLMELARLTPGDAELHQALKDLSARKTLSEGYEALADGKGSYRDILRNEKEAVSLEQQNRVQKTEDQAQNLIAEYEARLKTEPNNVRLLRNIAELYTQKKKFDLALQYYEKITATDAGANDASIAAAIASTKARRFDYQIEQLDATAPDYTDRVAQINAEKQAYRIAECQKRVEKNPTDLSIRYEMGVLYFEAGKITEAMGEFQKSKNNPNKKIASMNYLAQCFAKRKMYPLAASTLQEAIKDKQTFDEEKKDLVYNLGTVFEAMEKKKESVEQFEQIYAIDIGYKDVAAKVENFYSEQ